MAPGIALAAAAALVWMWVGLELDRLVFEAWGWSGGAVLVLLLALIEALGLGPLRRWQHAGLLPATSLHRPPSHPAAWRWITAPWQQPTRRQAALNLLLLAVILGPAALQLPDVLLRYSLVSLATLALAALVRAGQPAGEPAGEADAPGWGGASGAVASLIGLGVGLSLLQGRSLGYNFGPLTIPAWVLLLIDAGFELSWLAQQRRDAGAGLWSHQELLRQPWSWGVLLGLAWALLSQAALLVEAWRTPG